MSEPISFQAKPIERFALFATNSDAFLSRQRALIIAAFTLFYVPYVCARSALKPLWCDELFSILIARLGSSSQIMRALQSGLDSHPPLFFLLTHWSLKIGGNELIAGRLPAMIGFWLMCVCLFYYASERGPVLLAIFAMMLPLNTDLFFYATEARPYGVVLGFSASALLAWSSLSPSRGKRFFKLMLLWAALAAALSCHYYTVLLPVALLAGEATRAWRRRQVDWGVAAAIGLSFFSILAERSVIAGQTARVSVHWAKPALQTVLDFYITSLTPLLLPALVVLIAVVLYQQNSTARLDPHYVALPPDEGVVIAAFFLLPVGAYILGMLVTHAYTGRYSVSALIGITLLFWWLAKGLFRSGSASALIAVLCLVIISGVDEARSLRRAVRTHWTLLLQDDFPFSFDGDLPVVVQDARDFLPMLHYGSRQLGTRLTYVADPKVSLEHTGTVGLDVSLLDLVPWVPVQVVSLQQFEATHRHFLLFWGKPEKDALIGWQLTKFRDDGARVSILEEHGQRILFDVSLPEK